MGLLNEMRQVTMLQERQGVLNQQQFYSLFETMCWQATKKSPQRG